MKKISYLGPKGTYSEKAAKMLAEKAEGKVELLSLPSLEVVARSLVSEEGFRADKGVMAYYNYLEGLVQECLDLIYENHLKIVGAQRVPIELAIGRYPESAYCSNVHIFSHPKALAQCSEYLWTNHDSRKQMPVTSTAKGAQIVKQDKAGLAIASIDALNENGLEIIAEDIGNRRHGRKNFTDFYLVSESANDEIYEEGREYLTMVAITPHFDRPGLLANILGEIAGYGLNNAKIHSRPALDKVNLENNGEPQMFYLEVMNHKNSDNFKKCIDSLKSSLTPKDKDVEVVRILGSYERPGFENK